MKPPTGPAPGFTYRTGTNGRYAVRTFIDFNDVAEGEAIAAEVAAIATTESAHTGEPVTAQSVLRRAIRKGLPLVRLSTLHPTLPADRGDE